MTDSRNRNLDPDGGPERSPRSSAPKVRLSCEMCRQRKVKCDKLSPCTNCQRLGAVCSPVERARLPRGRSGKLTERSSDSGSSSKDLRGRVARLERLLRDLAQNHSDSGSGSNGTTMGVRGTETEGTRQQARSLSNPCDHSINRLDHVMDGQLQSPTVDGKPSPSMSSARASLEDHRPESHLGSAFWADLINQTPDADVHAVGDKAYYGTILFGTNDSENLSPAPTPEPSIAPKIREQLCAIYLSQVDPVFKILHAPSVRAFLLEGKPYLNYEPGHPTTEALANAIFYAAACSMSDEESLPLFGTKKASILMKYRRETEVALAQTDFITTNDVTVLQAFVLFLVSVRSQDQSRRVWTMLSMAVRVGQALSLHIPNPPFPVRPFERETRRRLWHAIALLDLQAALDRASEPMILATWLQNNLPSNVNDRDLSLDMQDAVPATEEFTDMTFTRMVAKAQCIARLLNFADITEPAVKYMHVRQRYMMEFQQTAQNLLSRCQPETVPLHWYARQVADCIAASMQLVILRPVHRDPNFIPPQVRGSDLLQLAMKVLFKTQELHSDPRGRPWRWFEGIFVPWHSLAVAIAELGVCDDAELMEQHWPWVELAFDRLRTLVADSQQGMLWKPMEKLMARARAKHGALIGDFPRPGNGRSSNAATKGLSFASAEMGTDFSAPASQWHSPPLLPHSSRVLDQASPASIPGHDDDTVTTGLDAWPVNVFDAMDLAAAGDMDNVGESSWSHYESFIDELHETDNPLWSLG